MYKNCCILSQINHPVVLVPLSISLCAHFQSSQKAFSALLALRRLSLHIGSPCIQTADRTGNLGPLRSHGTTALERHADL